ncbi:condensation domain-containing protein [Nocardia arthritidis]|uniref:condensation domain-containing protein n=1 Tax=Nocardia arthritidis TaxID=228602 RepID=UPI000AB37D43|nr:condensation domain-containing protein [Nocardia arthritidis]
MRFPVTAGQADLLLEQERPGSSSSHIGFVLEFAPSVDPRDIFRGVHETVRSCSALRLKFHGSAEAGYEQEIEDYGENRVALELQDVSDADDIAVQRYMDLILHRDAVAWDWNTRGVYKLTLIKNSGGRHHLVISLQQVAFDRRSMQVLLNRLVAAIMGPAAVSPFLAELDEYQSAVAATRPSEAEKAAAARYWKRELSNHRNAFEGHPCFAASRSHRGRIAIVGADYRSLRESIPDGGWSMASLFLQRFLSEWQQYVPRTTLVDTFMTCRPDKFENQIGMFTTLRPLVFDLSNDEWRRQTTAKLMRGSAYQGIDSYALRTAERACGIPQRPFPAYNFTDDSTSGGSEPEPSPVKVTKFAARRASARPVLLRVRDQGTSLSIAVHMNSGTFSSADMNRLLRRLAGG